MSRKVIFIDGVRCDLVTSDNGKAHYVSSDGFMISTKSSKRLSAFLKGRHPKSKSSPAVFV